MFNCLLEAARIIEDSRVGPQPVPQLVDGRHTYWAQQARPSPPATEAFDSADDLVVPRTESPDLSKSYTRCSETHNEVEKRRRAYLTQCYTRLQCAVPAIADCKASNVTVLRSAAEYILQLQHDEQRLIDTKERELRRRALLLSKLAVAKSSCMNAPAPYSMAYYHHPQQVAMGYPGAAVSPETPMVRVLHRHAPADDTETEDDDEEGVVPDPMSRGASPRATPVEGLTELNDAMVKSAQRKKIRSRVLNDLGNGRTAVAGKTQRRNARSVVRKQVF
eukprot:m.81984 g.81984  ORF g.81984 m.81984 type:complete len:277 (-) comp9434_c2_seq1:632-1462(-)